MDFLREYKKTILQSEFGCISLLLNCYLKLLFECKHLCDVCFFFPIHFVYDALIMSL